MIPPKKRIQKESQNVVQFILFSYLCPYITLYNNTNSKTT